MDFALPLLGDNPSHPSASPPRGESRGEMGGGGGGGRLHRPPPPPFLSFPPPHAAERRGEGARGWGDFDG